jgi:hypothetical protein
LDHLESQHWVKKSTISERGCIKLLIRFFYIGVIIALFSGCGFRRISRYKSISSLHTSHKARRETPALNDFVFYSIIAQANYYNDITITSAQTVKWSLPNIDSNPDEIFISVPSAGGNLATLIALQNEYFYLVNMVGPIKDAIPVDAAALDMYTFLKDNKSPSPLRLKILANN